MDFILVHFSWTTRGLICQEYCKSFISKNILFIYIYTLHIWYRFNVLCTYWSIHKLVKQRLTCVIVSIHEIVSLQLQTTQKGRTVEIFCSAIMQSNTMKVKTHQTRSIKEASYLKCYQTLRRKILVQIIVSMFDLWTIFSPFRNCVNLSDWTRWTLQTSQTDDRSSDVGLDSFTLTPTSHHEKTATVSAVVSRLVTN